MSRISKTSRAIARGSALATIALALVGNAPAAYISDGDFETPRTDNYTYRPAAATGVTFTNDAGIATNGYFYGPDTTNQYGFFQNTGDQTAGSNGGPGAITFAVTTLSAGSTYDVSFEAAQRSVGAPFTVLFDGVPLIGTFALTASETWQAFTTSFTAGGANGSLEFLGMSGGIATIIDDVVITARDGSVRDPGGAAVPEPAPIALLGSGMVAALCARRRSLPVKR